MNREESAKKVLAFLQKRVTSVRKPDFIIGEPSEPYLLRWWLLPRNPIFNVYLHQFLQSDEDRALHDHPYAWNASWLLSGNYIEHLQAKGKSPRNVGPWHILWAGDWKFRWGAAPHRIELFSSWDAILEKEYVRPVWTLFFTGPRVREWGFYCGKDTPAGGWRKWQDFVAPGTGHGTSDSKPGRGCD